MNPWLTVGASSSSKVSKKKNEVLLSKESSAVTKSQAMLKKQLGRTEDAVAREAEDAVVEIDLDNVMTLSTSIEAEESGQVAAEVEDASVKGKKAKGKGKVTISEQAKVDSAFRDSDDEGDDVEERAQKGGKAFKQRDLVALAFAGDNVVEVSAPCLYGTAPTGRNLSFTNSRYVPFLAGVQRSEAAGNRS